MARPIRSKWFWDSLSSLASRILVGFALASCAPTAPLVTREARLPIQSPIPSPYERLSPGKGLRTFSEFVLIDDFNTGDLKNRVGSLWQTEGLRPAELKINLERRDSLAGKRGKALVLSATLYRGKTGVVKSELKDLDVSQAKGLALKCRVETREGKPFNGELKLVLKDTHGMTQSVDFTAPCMSGRGNLYGWREAIFPRSDFAALDWNLMQEISFEIRAGPASLRAQIGVDELAFFGTGDLAFRSQKDNLLGFPEFVHDPVRSRALLAKTNDRQFLEAIARDTWKYFENAVDRKTYLPVDHLRVGDPSDVGSYTTPTNLALYLLACVAAHELGLIPRKVAIKRIRDTLETMRQMKRWKGFHYNFYRTHSLEVTRSYVSVVDLGWIASAWMILRQAFPKEVGEIASQFLKESRFGEFYDSLLGQMKLGFDEATGKYSPYHYGLISTEARVASFIGIGKGDLPRGHWWTIYRAPPKEWDWQSQLPEGKAISVEGYQVFVGFYDYQGVKFIPSWGGSLFEFLMPSLVMKEKELAPKSFGLNNRLATEINIDYALNRQGYPIWGISPASTASGRLWRYGEFGVKYLGVKGYRDEGIIAPYASFLALDTLPEQAIDNLRRMLELYPVYGEYGFYDSINLRSGRVNTQYLALDQGMILAALANYLKNGVLKEYFHRDEIAGKSESLLGKEEWFK